MKKNTFILMAMTTIFGLSSCDKELVPAEDFNNNNKKYVIYASTEDSRTKTSISGNDAEGYQVFWSEDDQFYVYKTSTVMDLTTHHLKKVHQRIDGPFVLKSGAGTTMGTFEKEGDALPNFTIMALYPDFPEAFSPAYLSDYYPTEQTYTEGNINGFPMIAQINVKNGKITGPVSFKNMGGILRLTVKGTATVKSIKVSAAELPTPITLDCGDGVELTSEGIDFHIAMPSADGIIEEGSSKDTLASYSNVSIYLTDTNGKVCCKSPKAPTLDIARSQITKATFSVNSKDFYSYTTGSKVKIHGHEGIVVDLNHDNAADVIVATMNVGATAVNGTGCLGTKMTYNAACAAWSGWRLPTVNELTEFCAPWYPAYGDSGEGEGNGAMMWDFDGDAEIDLYLPLNDYDEDGNHSDIYWTGTTDDGGDTYYYFAPAIEFDNDYAPLEPDYIRKEEAAKTSEFLVRLFHDLP